MKTENYTVQHNLLSDLEGALVGIMGLSEAIDELSSKGKHSERRLSAICAIGRPLHNEIAVATECCQSLYDLYFAEKSTG